MDSLLGSSPYCAISKLGGCDEGVFLGELGDLGFGVWTCLHDGPVNVIGDGWDNDIRDCRKLLLEELARTGGRELTIDWMGDRWVAEYIGPLDGWALRLAPTADAVKIWFFWWRAALDGPEVVRITEDARGLWARTFDSVQIHVSVAEWDWLGPVLPPVTP